MVWTEQSARLFAEEWIDSWNAHDLNRILSHYSNDFTMTSPFILKLFPESGGSMSGKSSVADYWMKALERYPDLHFVLSEVMFSINSLCIVYTSVDNLRAVEWLYFEEAEESNEKRLLVTKASGHYSSFPATAPS